MPKDSFTIKEVFENYMDNMEKKIEEIHGDVKEIKVIQQSDNGRVSKLEFWRNVIIWAFGILIALAPLILAFIKTQIRNTVVDVLATYDLERE